MIEFAVFNKQIADELVARGYKLEGKTRLAWLFKDSPQLEEAVAELVEELNNI